MFYTYSLRKWGFFLVCTSWLANIQVGELTDGYHFIRLGYLFELCPYNPRNSPDISWTKKWAVQASGLS